MEKKKTKMGLDYPNGEVRKSMVRLTILAMMDNSVSNVEQLFDELLDCLRSSDPQLVFQHIRHVMASFNSQVLFVAADRLRNFAETHGSEANGNETHAD
jgi:hypothetical protein